MERRAVKTVWLNGARMLSRENADAYLKRRLGLPAEHAANLDALYDALTECGYRRRLILMRYKKLFQAQPVYGERLRRMLTDAAAKNPALTVEIREGLLIR